MRKDTMNAHECAEYLRINHETVYRMAREKQLPHFRVRTRVFFSRNAIENWIKEQEQRVMDHIDS